MISCNILYENDAEISQVKRLREVLDKLYHEEFFFSSRTYKFKPVKVKQMRKEGEK